MPHGYSISLFVVHTYHENGIDIVENMLLTADAYLPEIGRAHIGTPNVSTDYGQSEGIRYSLR